MAMSQRGSAYNSTSGTGSKRGRPQRNPQRLPATRTVYEDFRPLSEWKTENDARILLVRLPGFLKEQTNYTKDDSKRYIRINGERALADNGRLRFNTTYTIPQNCNFNQMTTQFHLGILKITIPKLYNLKITPNVPQQDRETSTSQEKITTKPQKSDKETFTFGNKQEKEEEVAGKTLSENGPMAKRVDDERVAKEKNLELKKKEDSIGDRKTKDQETSTSQEKPTTEPQKIDEGTFTFGINKQEKEEEVAGKTLSKKGPMAKRVDDERGAKEKNLELKKKEDSIGDRKTKYQETSTSQEKPTTEPQKIDEETFTFGTNKQEKEEEVDGKTLSGKGSTAKRVDDERVAKEKNLELKEKEDSIGDRKTKDQETSIVLVIGRLKIKKPQQPKKSQQQSHERVMKKPSHSILINKKKKK